MELAFRTLSQKLRGLVPYPKVEEKPQVHESEDLSSGSALSFQDKLAQPLSLPLHPQALSLASTQILFLHGTDSSLPYRGQVPVSLWNTLPKEARVTAQQESWVLWHLKAPLLINPNQRKRHRARERYQ